MNLALDHLCVTLIGNLNSRLRVAKRLAIFYPRRTAIVNKDASTFLVEGLTHPRPQVVLTQSL